MTRVNEALLSRSADHGALVVNPETSRLHALNDSARAILDALRDGQDEDAVVATLTGAFDVSADEARAALVRFLAEARAAGLVLD